MMDLSFRRLADPEATPWGIADRLCDDGQIASCRIINPVKHMCDEPLDSNLIGLNYRAYSIDA